MRSYVGLTFDEMNSFFSSTSLQVSTLFAATPEFAVTHSDLDEEERDYILSMLAAEESLDMRESGFGFVLAADIPSDVIIEEGADSIEISVAIDRSWAACIFLVSPDGEELTWFAIQEVESLLPSWGN